MIMTSKLDSNPNPDPNLNRNLGHSRNSQEENRLP